MSVFRENAVVLNRLAQTSDLFSHVVALVEHLVQGHWDLVILVCLIQVKLNWARVSVPVLDSPGL